MISNYKVGDFVIYNVPHSKPELGRIKSISKSSEHPFVVYNCNDDWENYEDYTADSTNPYDLVPAKYKLA